MVYVALYGMDMDGHMNRGLGAAAVAVVAINLSPSLRHIIHSTLYPFLFARAQFNPSLLRFASECVWHSCTVIHYSM